ncbi:MAG: AAA family ATPase [Pseudomonas marincola]
MGSPDLSAQQSLHDDSIAFLSTSPILWDCDTATPDDVQQVETHGATVLLGRKHALKIKKPVKYDHMDFSTPEQRRRFCEHEVKLNQRTASELYIGVFGIYLTDDHKISLTGSSTPIDYFIKMNRFADEDRLDNFIEREGISEILGENLCTEISKFHLGIAPIKQLDAIPDFHSVIDQNFTQLDEHCPVLFNLDDVRAYRKNLHETYKTLKPLERIRIDDGWIRAGHGDLHLQNICMVEGKPLLFDAIEYEDDFVVGDVLYDISFLIMDLWQKSQKLAANLIFNKYLFQMGWIKTPNSLASLALLPFFLSMRSGIRTHVAASRYAQSQNANDKTRYADVAVDLLKDSKAFLETRDPVVIAIGGFSGSGKSTLAANLAHHIGDAPGALRIRSDVIRRLLIGWDDYSPMPQTAYTVAQSIAVYAHMKEIVTQAVTAGHSVIIDAVLDRNEDRSAFSNLAKDLDAEFIGLWLSVDEHIMSDRIGGRTRDASDATVEVMRAQMARNPDAVTDWINLDASGTETEITNAALQLLPKL